jgi:hypothetical protein
MVISFREQQKSLLAFGLAYVYDFMIRRWLRTPVSPPRRGTRIMAKKATGTRPAVPKTDERATVTPERFARLHLLLTLIAKAPQTRQVLARKLKLDIRGFYRDLEALRQAGIKVVLVEGRYHLTGTLDDARNGLPYPDPMLTLGEAMVLAKGRSLVHRRLQQMIARRLQ